MVRWHDDGRDCLCLDDVLLRPTYSELSSRSDCYPYTSIKLRNCVEPAQEKTVSPIIAANMAAITTPEMTQALAQEKVIVPIHRFCSVEEQFDVLNKGNTFDFVTAVSVGLDDRERIEFLEDSTNMFFLELAHAGTKRAVEEVQWIRKTFPQQLLVVGNVGTYDCAKILFDAGADYVKVGIGSGCFASGTRILLSNGFYKNIEDISIGDEIITGEGKRAKVKRSFCSGNKRTINIRHNLSGNALVCTPEHNYLVGDLNNVSKNSLSSHGYKKILNTKDKRKGKPNKIKWKQICQTKQDVLLFPQNIDFNLPETFSISLNKGSGGSGRWDKEGIIYSEDVVLTPSYDLGYFFGFFLGNGNSHCVESTRDSDAKNTIGSITLYPATHETEIINTLNNISKSLFNKEISWDKENKKSRRGTIYYKPLADFLYSFGKLQNKHLPQNLLVSNKSYLQGIYDGLLDSDGCIDGKTKRESFSNTSQNLIELFSILAFILNGHFPNIEKNKKSVGNLKGTKIENIKDSWIVRPLINSTVRETDLYRISKILDKSDISLLEIPVYDLEIEDEHHSFIANNCIVHNSVCSTREITGVGVPQLSAIIDCSRAGPIIADGGVKNSGDATKCLAAGASFVMIGSLLAGTTESLQDGYGHYVYYGSASEKNGKVKPGHVAEGISINSVLHKGSAVKVIQNLMSGIRQGMSMIGATTLEELRELAVFQKVTPNCYLENSTHFNVTHK